MVFLGMFAASNEERGNPGPLANLLLRHATADGSKIDLTKMEQA